MKDKEEGKASSRYSLPIYIVVGLFSTHGLKKGWFFYLCLDILTDSSFVGLAKGPFLTGGENGDVGGNPPR